MTQQYIRAFSLTIGDESGNSLDLSELRVVFKIYRAVVGTPHHSVMRVYNLAPETAKAIQKEFTQCQLQAGYEGNSATLFQGPIRQIKIGREDGMNTYLDILAAEDVMHNFSISNRTIASGWDQDSLLNTLAKDTSAQGVSLGFTPTFRGPTMPRGKVVYGMTKNYLQTLADASGCDWYVENNELSFLPITSTLPTSQVAAVVVNSLTGMIGAPRQTLNGVELRVLINPLIRVGGLLQIDNASIQTLQMDPSFNASSATNNIFFDPNTGKNTGLDADGLYKVYAIDMSGDTRGQDWYFNIICTAMNGQGPISDPFINAVVSENNF